MGAARSLGGIALKIAAAGDTTVTEDSLTPAASSPVLSHTAFVPCLQRCPTSAVLLLVPMGCMWAPCWRWKVSVIPLLVLIAWQPVSILLLCLSFPARKTHKPPWGRSSGAGGQKREVLSPAGHQDCFVGSELLPVHDDDDVSQDIPASKAVEIEEDITRVAGELDAAVCRRGHLESARNTSGRRTGMETRPGEHPTSAERQLLLWDAFRWPGRDGISSSVLGQTAPHHAKCLPGLLVRSLGQQQDLACLSPTQAAGERRRPDPPED